MRHRRALWTSAPPSHISPASRTCDVCGAKVPQKYKQAKIQDTPTHNILNTAFTNTNSEERALEGEISRGALVSLLFKDSAACSDLRPLRETWRNPKYQTRSEITHKKKHKYKYRVFFKAFLSISSTKVNKICSANRELFYYDNSLKNYL